jgi:hypothetical protein
MQTEPRKSHLFGLVHRYGGISGAVIIILVCITGLLLNHTDDFELSKRSINSEWLLDWYGIETPQASSFTQANRYASELGETLYLDEAHIPGNFGSLKGVVKADEAIVIATDRELVVLTLEGELIEVLNPTTLTNLTQTTSPANIQRLGVSDDDRIIIETTSYTLISDAQLLMWEISSLPGLQVAWSQPASLPAAQLEAIKNHYRGAGLSLERIVLDLHSGRLFRAGPWLGDAIALLFITLAMTGIWMWFKTRKRNT